jgi:pimeloyl-ACP methyl ester carboxylesterase
MASFAWRRRSKGLTKCPRPVVPGRRIVSKLEKVHVTLFKWMLNRISRLAVQPMQANVDGHRMHYLRAGDGPPCVLIHGLLGTADAWRPCLLRLGRERTVLAPDALGIGLSERVEGLDASLEATARRLRSFFDAVGVERADLVGTSHGGGVALQFAALFPERVRSLTLHAPVNPYSNLADPLIRFYQSKVGRWFAMRIPQLPERLQNLALGRMYADPEGMAPGAIEGWVRPLKTPGTIPHILRIVESWDQDMESLRGVLDRLAGTPILLLWGTHDRAVSIESGYRLLRHFERAEFALIPGTGHLPFEETPEVFSDLVSEFLRKPQNEAEATGRRRRPGLLPAWVRPRRAGSRGSQVRAQQTAALAEKRAPS